jgi:hypothetical protein
MQVVWASLKFRTTVFHEIRIVSAAKDVKPDPESLALALLTRKRLRSCSLEDSSTCDRIP